MTIRALLIDDDVRLFELLSSYLGNNDVDVSHATDGGRGLAELERQPYDVVLLDVMMPGMSGLDVIQRLRSKSTAPVVMLTAKGDETDRIVGLEMGADDYLPKPFNPRELLARIRAVLRRASPEVAGKELRVGPFAIDVDARTVRRDEERLELTGIEFDLLVALARRKGRVLDREVLLREAGRGDVSVSERTVDVHISHLRQKLGDDRRAPRFIKTVRGVGYVLTDGEEG
jgi:DNA-binding response OmpR family regulator